MSTAHSIVPDKDFDTFNSQRLHQLEADLAVEQQRLAAAEAVAAALATRASSTQAAATAAQTAAAAAATNLTAAQTAAQTVAQGVPITVEAHAQAAQVVAHLTDVLGQAHATAELLVDALARIAELGKEVKLRTGKNELISAVVINGTSQAQVDASNALNAVTVALQNTMLAYAATQEAGHASGKVISVSTRLRQLLAPEHRKFHPEVPLEGGVNAEGVNPLETMRDLARTLEHEPLSILATLEAFAEITKAGAAEQQCIAVQAASDLNLANSRLARANAATKAATAALAAASAAVA